MSTVETIPEAAEQRSDLLSDPPQLLVHWTSPWEEFKSALGPALTRSPRPLGGEAPVGIFPYRGILIGWLIELLVLLAAIILPSHLGTIETQPAHQQWDVIYYSGDELPRTQDRGGAESGTTGRAGGRQAHHRTQTIRVVRGEAASEQVADAPKINLPHSDSAVANLLAFKPNPGPPPAEGMRSTLAAPTLPAMSVVPPSPEVNSSTALRTPSDLLTSIVPPSPEISRANTRNSPTLSTEIVAPAPNVSREKMRSADPLAPTVIAPAPKDAQRDLASSRMTLTQTSDVVAPPVSAPPRDVSSRARLSLPASAVVAPPPSSVSREINSWGSTASGDMRMNPVPPPPTAAGGSSLSRSGVGALAQQVVPPPASFDGKGSDRGNGRSAQAAASMLGEANVVPPPPGIGGGNAASGNGRGNKGTGAGGAFDVGPTVAPSANAGGNAAGAGVVVSSQPGTQVGMPNSKNAGVIAMAPTGTAKTGLGGGGIGSSIGRGVGPGSGLGGEGTGAGRNGGGRGSDPNSHAGVSQYPGPGGSGSGANSPAMPGVSVEGGTTTINLPSFGAPGGDAPSSGPGHSSVNPREAPGFTVKATSGSGGVFSRYGELKGYNYSIYFDTSLGMAVMQYADASSAGSSAAEDISQPRAIRSELPDGLRSTYVVFACILDRSGNLKDVRVLERGDPETTSRILASLHNWKFRPAMRGNDPVEVNAFLGFGIDTR